MADPNTDFDAQDSAEAFDEDNLDASETYKYRTFEENDEVIDLTRADGDEDEDDGEFLAFEDEDLDEDDDADLSAADETDLSDDDSLDIGDVSPDEAQLVYVGDVENLRGAQGSAAHFEPRAELSDDDVEALGYADEDSQ